MGLISLTSCIPIRGRFFQSSNTSYVVPPAVWQLNIHSVSLYFFDMHKSPQCALKNRQEPTPVVRGSQIVSGSEYTDNIRPSVTVVLRRERLLLLAFVGPELPTHRERCTGFKMHVPIFSLFPLFPSRL